MPASLATPLPQRIQGHFHSLEALIGDTPLIELECELEGIRLRVFAKHEVLNLTGSIKDRMALGILREAWEAGAIHAGTTLVEATSGNTGIAFAALGRALGHPVRIYMPDWMSKERVLLIQSLGAQIVPVSAAEGGFLGSIALADAFAAERPSERFLPHQFANPANARAHERGTARELVAQLRRLGVVPQAFVAGVGTGGTVMGVGPALKSAYPDLCVHPLEPSDSPTLRTGKKVGKHRIQGISDEFIPPLVELRALDEIVDVRDGDAIRMARRLASELGLGLGISSGANLLGALLAARRHGPGAVATTVFPDSNKKYLSTDLMHDEPAREDDWTARVEFRAVRVHPRAGLAR